MAKPESLICLCKNNKAMVFKFYKDLTLFVFDLRIKANVKDLLKSKKTAFKVLFLKNRISNLLKTQNNMKKSLLALGVAMIAFFSVNAQEITTGLDPKPSLAEIAFEKDVHDYGNIKQNANGNCEFKFKNTGKEPLIISMARGSCGCTVPDWPKEPIKPGESAVIKVNYDTKRVGPINKTVTITSNAKNESTKVLTIKGNVEAVAEETFPGKAPAGAPVENNK
jgi:hypothetical protein